MKPVLAETIAYYLPILERYAMRLINNEVVTSKIVTEVLEDQYEIDGLIPSPHLKQLLLTDTRNRCICYAQVQIFDRPVVKVPAREYHSSKQNSSLLKITVR